MAVVPGKQRRQQGNKQSGAHACAGIDDFDADIACALEQAQITLHGAPVPPQRAHQVCDGDFGAARFAVAAVDIFRQLAGAAARAVRQVGIIFDLRGQLRDVSAGRARRGVPGFRFGGKVTATQRAPLPGGVFVVHGFLLGSEKTRPYSGNTKALQEALAPDFDS